MKLTKRKKKQIQRISVMVIAGGVVAAAILTILFTIGGFIYHRFFSADDTINYEKVTVEQPVMKKMLLTPNVNSGPQKKLKKVKGIVIHYTANPGSEAEANRNYFESRKDEEDSAENKVSSHFVIGLDGMVIQCIPLDEIAYASNERNKDTISIECCHPDKSGKFTKETYESLISLCAWLCDEYEIEKKNIIRHYDVTGKMCPLYYVKKEEKWNELKDSVWNLLKEKAYHIEYE